MQALDTKVEVSFSPLLHCYTLEELWALPEPEDHSYYELIGGVLFAVPPPDPPHDDIDARLNMSLAQHLIARNVRGDILHPHASIYKDVAAGTYLEPDMMYVSQELKTRMGRKRSSADIVFEYVSRSNAVYDRTTKADTYLALGVRELWLIDPFTLPSKCVMRLCVRAGRRGRPGAAHRATPRNREYCKGGVSLLTNCSKA